LQSQINTIDITLLFLQQEINYLLTYLSLPPISPNVSVPNITIGNNSFNASFFNLTIKNLKNHFKHEIKELNFKLKHITKEMECKDSKIAHSIEELEEHSNNAPELSLKIKSSTKRIRHEKKSESHVEKKSSGCENNCDSDSQKKKVSSHSLKSKNFNYSSSKKVLVSHESFKVKFESSPVVVASLVSSSGENVENSSFVVTVHSVSKKGCTVYVSNPSATGEFKLPHNYRVKVLAYGN
jgi:hypothetical protein